MQPQPRYEKPKRKPSLKARQALVEANRGFAYMLAKRYGPSRGLSEEDAVQAALLGMTWAAEFYVPNPTCKFISYAKFRMLREINKAGALNHGGCSAGAKRMMSGRFDDADELTKAALSDPLSYDNDSNPYNLPDVASVSPEQYAIDQEARGMLRALIATLPPRWRKVIELRYLTPDELTLREVGAIMGFSRQYAERIEFQALLSMKLTYQAWREEAQ